MDYQKYGLREMPTVSTWQKLRTDSVRQVKLPHKLFLCSVHFGSFLTLLPRRNASCGIQISRNAILPLPVRQLPVPSQLVHHCLLAALVDSIATTQDLFDFHVDFNRSRCQ